MSVQPGFGGQAFQAKVLAKSRRIKSIRPQVRVCIDGGINPVTAPDAVAAGCDLLVAGSAVFRDDATPREALEALVASVAHRVFIPESP
jgi:ribulose-phosphate 3-epimerase